MNKYLNTYNSNQDYKLTYGSECKFQNHLASPNSLLYLDSNFNPVVPIQTEVHEDEESTLDAPNYQNYNFRATNFLKRNSTVKEIRKQKLIGTKNKLTHEPQSVADEEFVRIHKKRRHRNKNRAKKFRQLSRGNQVFYKGPRGFELIKKYRHRRRNESCQYRQSSLNPSGFFGSVRSRNKSSEGFLSSARSCSSGCNSAKRSNNANLIRNKQPGFFTRNKLNAKYRAISEAKKMRLQRTLNKIMKIHANHADVDHLSPKSSTALCESINQSSNIKEPCKCGLISSGTVSHQRSTERNLNFDTPKVSICDHDYVQLSRNYEQTKKFYNFSNKTSQYSLLKVGEGKNYVFNSHGKVSPKSISNSSHRKIGTRTQKPSFVESSNDINLCNVRHYPNKRQISDVVPLQPVMEAGLIIPKDQRFFQLGEDSCSPQRSICKESKRMKSGVTVTHHTASSSLNKEYVLTFDSNDVPLSTNPS